MGGVSGKAVGYGDGGVYEGEYGVELAEILKVTSEEGKFE